MTFTISDIIPTISALGTMIIFYFNIVRKHDSKIARIETENLFIQQQLSELKTDVKEILTELRRN